jgi:hypothetical protein
MSKIINEALDIALQYSSCNLAERYLMDSGHPSDSFVIASAEKELELIEAAIAEANATPVARAELPQTVIDDLIHDWMPHHSCELGDLRELSHALLVAQEAL